MTAFLLFLGLVLLIGSLALVNRYTELRLFGPSKDAERVRKAALLFALIAIVLIWIGYPQITISPQDVHWRSNWRY